MVDPKDITFCVKTFNRPRLLHRCLSSLRWASPESSIVVVDDSTTDNEYSPEILSHITLIRTEPNIGVADGRNKAIAAAATPFCFVLDDDHGIQKRTNWGVSLALVPDNWLNGIVGWPLRYSNRIDCGFEFFYKNNNADIAIIPTGRTECDFLVTNFLAPTELLKSNPYPAEMKTREHFTWFYDLSQTLKPPIHQMPDRYAWLHMDGPETESREYTMYRNAVHNQPKAMKERSLNRLVWVRKVSNEEWAEQGVPI